MILTHATASSITDVSFQLPAAGQIADVLLLRAGFNSALVIIGASLLGLAAGVVGSFALLRKRALMGDALAHCSLPGLALAFIWAVSTGHEERSLPILLSGAALSGVVGILCVQLLSGFTRLSEDSAIGAVLSIFFGSGVVLLSVIQSMETGSAGGLSRFIYGQTAAMRIHDAYLLAGAGLAISAICFLLMKEFSLVCFDPDFAVVQGWPIGVIDLVMMGLVTVVTVIGLQSVGMILIVALLIIPAAAARFWTEHLSKMIFISAFIGAISGYLGSAASALLPRLPAGSVIVLTAGLIFTFSFVFAPERGIFAGTARLMKLRFRVLKDHLLRDVYETHEQRGIPFETAVPLQTLVLLRGVGSFRRWIMLSLFSCLDLIRVHNGSLALTQKGLEEAKQLIRNHRLWEQYLIRYAHVSTSHVDYSADYVEHVLSPELIRELEEGLLSEGLLDTRQSPGSVHPLRPEGPAR